MASAQLTKHRARWAAQRRVRAQGMGTLPRFQFDYPEQIVAEQRQEERQQWWRDNWQNVLMYGGGAAALAVFAGWPLIGPKLKAAGKKTGKYVQIGKG
jgi:hypothetical protein